MCLWQDTSLLLACETTCRKLLMFASLHKQKNEQWSVLFCFFVACALLCVSSLCHMTCKSVLDVVLNCARCASGICPKMVFYTCLCFCTVPLAFVHKTIKCSGIRIDAVP